MTDTITIAQLRTHLGLTLVHFARELGLVGVGNVSTMERENRAALKVALRLEQLASEHGLRLDAASICDDVALSRAACLGGCEAVDAGAAVHGDDVSSEMVAKSAGKSGEISRAPAPAREGAREGVGA
jgi:hypothetical protein